MGQSRPPSGLAAGLPWDQALAEITAWFKAYQSGEDMYTVTRDHILAYTQRAQELGVEWATTAA
ncbi:MAG: hypothetical protein R3C44_01320 [Chloroflexota bacterium]